MMFKQEMHKNVFVTGVLPWTTLVKLTTLACMSG